jgi:hypothetical protein
MGEQERFMSRARAKWRAKKKGKASLWGFENWANEGKEVHHIAREKYGDATIPVPISTHPELTRPQMEEHPEEGPDPTNPLEREGRLCLGWADILECLADLFRVIGEYRIEAAKRGERDLTKSVDIPEYLGGFLRLISESLIEAANGPRLDLKG